MKTEKLLILGGIGYAAYWAYQNGYLSNLFPAASAAPALPQGSMAPVATNMPSITPTSNNSILSASNPVLQTAAQQQANNLFPVAGGGGVNTAVQSTQPAVNNTFPVAGGTGVSTAVQASQQPIYTYSPTPAVNNPIVPQPSPGPVANTQQAPAPAPQPGFTWSRDGNSFSVHISGAAPYATVLMYVTRDGQTSVMSIGTTDNTGGFVYGGQINTSSNQWVYTFYIGTGVVGSFTMSPGSTTSPTTQPGIVPVPSASPAAQQVNPYQTSTPSTYYYQGCPMINGVCI